MPSNQLWLQEEVCWQEKEVQEEEIHEVELVASVLQSKRSRRGKPRETGAFLISAGRRMPGWEWAENDEGHAIGLSGRRDAAQLAAVELPLSDGPLLTAARDDRRARDRLRFGCAV